MTVCVYVEGGGPHENTKTACRKAFRTLIEKVVGEGRRLRVIACGDRDQAYKDFCRALADDRDTPILLVDSEDAVQAGMTPSVYLRLRGWEKPLPDGQVHLMVQCMESWFLADKMALAEYFKQGFRPSALAANPHFEQVSKRDVINGLDAAAKDTNKGRYHKTRDGFQLLERIDPGAVRRCSPHADAFFAAMLARLS